MTDYKYKFSIITAVYNVENYLAEAIDSIIAQDIGFQNVQFILIDDGTPDNSGAICDEYAQKYPDNIKVVHKENGGVSSARNMGIALAEGKYVNFFDSDDKLTKNTLRLVWNFFEKHYNETDVVAIPFEFFDGQKGGHALNYKFGKRSRVIDLNEEWSCIQLSTSSAFIKNEVIKKQEFDSRLAYAEDAKVMQRILLEKQTLGVIPKAVYMYRRRTVGAASAIQSSHSKFGWYTPYMKYFQRETIEYALEKYGYVPKFIQFALMYDLQWRIKLEKIPEGVLTEEEYAEYFSELRNSFSFFDDEIISAQRHLFREYKTLAFSLKYNKDPEIGYVEDRYCYKFTDEIGFEISYTPVIVDSIDIDENVIRFKASVGLYNMNYDEKEIYLLVNDERVEITSSFDRGEVLSLNNTIIFRHGFTAEIPLNKSKTTVIKIAANINGQEVIFKKLNFGRFTPLSSKYSRSYICEQKYMLTYYGGNLIVRKSNFARRTVRELKLLLQIALKDGGLGIGAAAMRMVMHFYKLFKRKPVWLVSDRATLAGDNGEALFIYLCKNHPEIDVRFVISEDCEDFNRIKQIGPVLKKDSFKHKIVSLISKNILSSHAENEIYIPLRSRIEPFKSFGYKTNFIFLQHGITQNNVSGWLAKSKKNFSGIVTAAVPERDSFLQNPAYGYDEENIWLTGFCRFDRLNDENEKRIVIMPTWRKYLTSVYDPVNDIWSLIDDFEESSFYKFYNGIVNSEKLITAANKYGYTIEFFPHPTLRPHIERFNKHKDVEFLGPKTAYKDIYSKSALVITDYSSAAFDFAYLRKPIIYTHFDIEAFYSGSHICEDFGRGYFDYERDGFGEVEYDLDSTIDRIIEYMENGCELKPEYRERIDNFFAFNDKDNCKRVYEKVIALDKNNR